MLGRALVATPDVLLLDEPTNHLDIDAISWLENMMLEYPGALLFVSHDRAFVRRLATKIVELDRGQLRAWPGGYDNYVVQKRAALEVEAKHAALFDKKLAQEEVWIRQGVEARRTRNEGRVRALEQLRIQRRERRERIGNVELRAQDAAPSGKLVFEAQACNPLLRLDRHHSRFLGPHPAPGSHRHHWPQWLRQDHADQAAGGRIGTERRHHQTRHQSVAGVLRPAARAVGSDGIHRRQRNGRQRRHGDHRRSSAPRFRLPAGFFVPARATECAREHVVGRGTQSLAVGALVRTPEQSFDHG